MILFSILLPPTLRPVENNKPPVADAGPEKELTLPVDRTTLDGSKSSDDQKIDSYHWRQARSVGHRTVHTVTHRDFQQLKEHASNFVVDFKKF